VSNQIPIAKLDKIQFVSGLPKTRSGKIMRRILRKIAEGDYSNFGDTSTLLNPEIVEEIRTVKFNLFISFNLSKNCFGQFFYIKLPLRDSFSKSNQTLFFYEFHHLNFIVFLIAFTM
jgi:hypothetical protein